MFTVEVVGLRQSQATDTLNYAIRQSGSIWLQVPYARLNQEIRRIQRLGGRIVRVRPQQGRLPTPPVIPPRPRTRCRQNGKESETDPQFHPEND